jgi:hypothetical protein
MDVSPFRDIGSQTKLKNRPAAKIQKARKLKINSEARKPGTWEKLRFQIRLFLVSWFLNSNFRDQFRSQEPRKAREEFRFQFVSFPGFLVSEL